MVGRSFRTGRKRKTTLTSTFPLTGVDTSVYIVLMNSDQFRRYLSKQGCTFEEGKRHTIVRRDGKMAALPRHGGSKQLGTGLMNQILKDLGLK